MNILRPARRFIRDDRGSLIVEFALWLPWLLFWLIFSLAAFLHMNSRGDAAKATYAVSDIVSRFNGPITRADLGDLDFLYREMQNGGSGLQMRVSSIQFINGAHTVLWTECFGGTAGLVDQTIPLEVIPTMANLDTVILTETFTPYLPISNLFGLRASTFEIRVATRPRFVPRIENSPDPSFCVQPGSGDDSS